MTGIGLLCPLMSWTMEDWYITWNFGYRITWVSVVCSGSPWYHGTGCSAWLRFLSHQTAVGHVQEFVRLWHACAFVLDTAMTTWFTSMRICWTVYVQTWASNKTVHQSLTRTPFSLEVWWPNGSHLAIRLIQCMNSSAFPLMHVLVLWDIEIGMIRSWLLSRCGCFESIN